MRAANRCRGPFLLTVALAVGLASVSACKKKTPAEKIGDKIENAGDKIEDKIDEAN
jgi:hypothetical protein